MTENNPAPAGVPDGPEAPLHPAGRSACFVCGDDNPSGMKLKFRVTAEGESEAEWTPVAAWEGYPGLIHGGLISTVLDEAMSKAVASTQVRTLTAEMRVRYRRMVETGGRFVIRGKVTERGRRMIRAEAWLVSEAGDEHAHAWGSFIPAPDGKQ
jgi:acyl-coenzyme A thioesterase PaaI-like protein